jgi:hypothetical protein
MGVSVIGFVVFFVKSVLQYGNYEVYDEGIDVTYVGLTLLCLVVFVVLVLYFRTSYKKVFVSFDNEPAAQAKARKLAEDLDSLGMDVEVVNICEDYGKNDPGELTVREVKEIKRELFS